METTLATKTEHKVGERMLGTDPKSGKPVSVKIGRFGPVVQIGSSDDEEKPRFAQLNKEHSLETITLEEALDLFKLPRVLGELDGTTVLVGVGRFGPYVRHGNEYVSIPKEMDPMAVTFEEAVRMLSEKKEKEAQKIIKQFPENPDMQILNGRYGPYIAYQKKNYKIPENVNPADLNLDACFKVIELQAQKAEMRKAKGAKAKTKEMKRVFLIGYMGSGKTTLGKAYSAATGLRFVDLDWYIEERMHKSISDLFAERGEDGFRLLGAEDAARGGRV